MSRKFTPTLVYQRKGKRKSSASSVVQITYSSKPSNGCHSAISSEAPSLATQGRGISASVGATDAVRSPVLGSVDCDTVANTPLNGCHTEVEADSVMNLMMDVGGILNTCCANDNYSSSKSNLESSASLKRDMDEAGECSSSGALIMDKGSKEISERDMCISILRSQGLLTKVQRRQDRASTGNSGVSSAYYCTKSCKVCERLERTLGMLVCDNCEDAFHISCYSPRITILPTGEWFCGSCLEKKNKTFCDWSTSNSGSNSGKNRTEIDRRQYSTSEYQLGSLGFMFRDTEPYLSSVRIGSDFQADIPDMCGHNDEASHLMGDPLDVKPSNVINKKKRDAPETVKLNPIGNWIQCQEVTEGADGTICGKWRRAPLFEVQTDDWECFRCFLWDPAHADCAVPQEVDTKEVMRQLKYIKMLRPQLAAKRRNLVSSRRNGT